VRIAELSPLQLKERLDRGDALVLLDVREPHEWEICRIDGARLVPMRTVPEHTSTLPRDRDIVVHCRSGARSARVAEWLHAQGFERVYNLAGGILAWIDTVDPSQRKY